MEMVRQHDHSIDRERMASANLPKRSTQLIDMLDQ